MAIKYQRDKFYDDVEVNGFLEKDFLSGYFQKFKIIRPMTTFKVSSQFIQRPDLLSMKLYGKISYWPIIGYVNNIHDWWNDLNVEDVIQVPNIRDIEDWYVEIKILRKNKSKL